MLENICLPADYRHFFELKMQVVPIEKEIQATHEALPYEKVSSIIETGQSFMVQDCICKKEQALLDDPCDRPLEVCLAIAPIEGVFDNTS